MAPGAPIFSSHLVCAWVCLVQQVAASAHAQPTLAPAARPSLALPVPPSSLASDLPSEGEGGQGVECVGGI